MARTAIPFCVCASLLLGGCGTPGRTASNPFRRTATTPERSDPATRTRTADRDQPSPRSPGDRTNSAAIERELAQLEPADRQLIEANIAAGYGETHVLNLARQLRLARRAQRVRDGGSPDRSPGEGSDEIRIAGGHSHDPGAVDPADHSTPLTDLRDAEPSRRPADEPFGVSPWGSDDSHTAGFRSHPQRWPADPVRPEEDEPRDRRPAASVANGSPIDLASATRTRPGAFDPPEQRDLRVGPETERPRRPTDVSRSRTLDARFDATPPGVRDTSVPPGDPLGQLIDDTSRELRALEPGDDPGARLTYVRKHVLLRTLYLADGQPERAFVAIPGLDDEEQAFWRSYLWATANYFDAEGIEKPEDRAGQTVTQLRDAIRALQTKARLDLRNVTFCDRIASFGNYEPFEQNDFAAGQEVLVYAEVENFHSVPTEDDDYETLLHSTAEFYGADGQRIGEPIVFGESKDRSRNHRRDFFLAFQFTLPNLPRGNYRMNLIVRDELSGRTDTHTMKFAITR